MISFGYWETKNTHNSGKWRTPQNSSWKYSMKVEQTLIILSVFILSSKCLKLEMFILYEWILGDMLHRTLQGWTSMWLIWALSIIFLVQEATKHTFSFLFVHLAMLYTELGTIQLGDKKESHKEPICLTDNQKKTKQ